MGEEELPESDEVVDLIRQLGARSMKQRRVAAQRLGDIGDERAVEPLVALALNDDSPAGDAAVTAVGRLGGGRALSVLQSMLQVEEPLSQRPRRPRGPSTDRPTDRFDALAVLATDDDPEVRRAALVAVAGLGDLRGLGYAIASLNDRDRRVRRQAARALGRMGGVAATESLRRALDEEADETVRRAISEALAAIAPDYRDE